MNNKIRGCIIGGAVGDALGYPIEFVKGIKNKQVTCYDDGIISDDTQMTLFTANALLWRETRFAIKGIALAVEDAVYFAYLDWLETQNPFEVNVQTVTWLKKIDELRVNRSAGLTCLSALASREVGTLKKRINDSNGCGGVMRVAPFGIYARNAYLAGESAAKASAITHGNDLSILASFLFAYIIHKLIRTEMSIFDAVTDGLENLKVFRKKNKICNRKKLKNFTETINNAIGLSGETLEDNKIVTKIGEGWVADEALAIALYSCIKYSDNFEAAVICAVNHDGDSDSTGAIAGNIIGAYLGYEKIPSRFIEKLQLKEIILEIADDLSVEIPVNSSFKNNDEYWMSKYWDCDRNVDFKKEN